MVRIPQSILHACHVVYDDGRVYLNHHLVAHCKTFSAAKAWATRANKKHLAERTAEHHQRVQAIVAGGKIT